MDYVAKKSNQSEVKVIDDNVFEKRLTKNAAQFTKSLQNIASYVQMNYNS